MKPLHFIFCVFFFSGIICSGVAISVAYSNSTEKTSVSILSSQSLDLNPTYNITVPFNFNYLVEFEQTPDHAEHMIVPYLDVSFNESVNLVTYCIRDTDTYALRKYSGLRAFSFSADNVGFWRIWSNTSQTVRMSITRTTKWTEVGWTPLLTGSAFFGIILMIGASAFMIPESNMENKGNEKS